MSETSGAAQQAAEAHPQATTGAPRGMVILVAVLGVVLVIGMLALIAAVVVRITQGDPNEAKAKDGPAIADTLALPQDGGIERVWTDGDRLIIHTADPAGKGKLVVYDLRKGQMLARIAIE